MCYKTSSSCSTFGDDSVVVVVLREIEYLKKETQRCAQDGAEASELQEESGQLEEQVTVNLPRRVDCSVGSRMAPSPTRGRLV